MHYVIHYIKAFIVYDISKFMSRLKDFYVNEMKHDYNRIQNSVWYLSELSLRSAIEIDNYIIGKDKNFEETKELAEIFEKYKLKDTDNVLTEPIFPFSSLIKSMIKSSQKEIGNYSELALNINLLNLELKNVPTNFNMLKELRSFLCDFSRELSNERTNNCFKYRL